MLPLPEPSDGCRLGGKGLGVSVGSKDGGLGVGVSAGGSKGVNAGLGVGTSHGVGVGVGASVGGSKGVNAGLGANVGGKKQTMAWAESFGELSGGLAAYRLAVAADQIWVQPAPHPIRPSEMWHPAELAPAPLPRRTSSPG